MDMRALYYVILRGSSPSGKGSAADEEFTKSNENRLNVNFKLIADRLQELEARIAVLEARIARLEG